MRLNPLILIVNLGFLLAGCATGAPPAAQAVNPAPVAPTASATAAQFMPGGGAYLSPLSLNLYRLLPPPPVAGSTQERAELDELLQIQAARTPEQIKRAQADATVSVFRFADALGSPAKFTAADLPRTAALFGKLAQDEALFLNSAKDAFGRPRPPLTERRLNPVVPLPPTASYPSGHTTYAVACAIVLSDMVPERRSQLFARADEYAHNREVAGVHYPSDVAAGHLAGTALAAALFQSPQFLNDEVAATAELRQALSLPPLPRHQLYRH